MAPFEYVSQGRNPRTIIALAVAYVLLIGAVVVIDAAPWLMGIIGLATLPAIWDLWMNPAAGVTLDDTTLRWFSGRRRAEVALEEITKVRFDARWDFSVRVSLVLDKDRKIRLPAEALPPRDAFDRALQDRGIRTERNPFSIL